MRVLLLVPILLLGATPDKVTVGSKPFPESVLLAEIYAQLLEDRGFEVERRMELTGTIVCFGALEKGEIDFYPEYTGTIEQAILKLDHRAGIDELRWALRKRKLDLLEPIGFNNTYAIVVGPNVKGVTTIGDLAEHPKLRLAFSHEFLERKDGWPGLAAAYGLGHKPVGIEHGLAYQAIESASVDVTDAYSTDGKLVKYRLKTLLDDRDYFPKYLAVPFIRADLPQRAQEVIGLLAGKITDGQMTALNARVEVDQEEYADVAQDFLRSRGLLQGASVDRSTSMWGNIAGWTMDHLLLSFGSLFVAILIAMPLGILVYRLGPKGKPILYFAGILQTIPAIALLGLLLWVLGIGWKPAMAALVLYALLPILRNTTTALVAIDPVMRKVGVGMGLTRAQLFRHVELPLAMPTILAGIRTAAVITIGFATLAAFIGAGGLGQPIYRGLQLDRTDLILQGALPAILLAVLTELAFEGLERVLVPKHLLGQKAER